MTTIADSSEGLITKIIKASEIVSGRVFGADRVPATPTFPYVTFQELDSRPEIQGDAGMFAEWAKQFQVDVIQEHSRMADLTLRRQLIIALKSTAPYHVAGHRVFLRVRSAQRLPVQPGETAMRDTITLVIFQPEESL